MIVNVVLQLNTLRLRLNKSEEPVWLGVSRQDPRSMTSRASNVLDGQQPDLRAYFLSPVWSLLLGSKPSQFVKLMPRPRANLAVPVVYFHTSGFRLILAQLLT